MEYTCWYCGEKHSPERIIVRITRHWEDLGRIFRPGEIVNVLQCFSTGDFYTDSYYLIPKSHTEKLRGE